ncbi:hypothetical protein GHO45_00475 [Pseudomonas sp. FSL R10-0765]|jgi:hypothetical protein|uniref:diguanylate cyclase regulator RdcB family protein n=1 Tax=Pseudomonas TaxID=286 RepID=UPI0012960244|nr:MULTISPECIES: diguanylate cyclase regulator RdcB family protein [Pseudomonas]MQT39409.1 hypothetical protein [Pseudomonas sp. FSL R10-0765]NNB17043.1 hypothetical protein [Pseudomonas fragi]NNB21654.1 hypothetical protein [Pseudomonas fragi]
MNETDAIAASAEVCQLLTCVPEKFVVDFANGIDVARERQRHMATRTGFYSRLYDGFTGQGARHQAEINASLTDGVEGALNWLVDLSESLARSNRAIVQVQTRINGLKHDVALLVDYSVQTRQTLNLLSQRLDERCDALDRQVARIDSLQQAQLHLDRVFGKWGAGRFNGLSLSGRCYAVIEELRWGAFGDYCQVLSGHERQAQLDDLANRAIIQLSRDANVGHGERLGTHERWMARPAAGAAWFDGEEAVRYLGDWTDPGTAPFAYAVSQMPEELPLQVPRLGSAHRMAEGLISELFQEAAA